MNSHKLLEKQVALELKKRRIVLFTSMFFLLLYLVGSFTLGDSGLIRYLELRSKKAQIELEVRNIELNNNRLKSELKLLNENPFYLEKHAREEFGMARPDEYIFKYDR